MEGVVVIASAAALDSGAVEEGRLRASLESIRTKAEDLRDQAAGWAAGRSEQARDLVDDRPLTVLTGAFCLGLVVGLLVAR